MFQVEPILWLQHHGGETWRAAMAVVSTLGLSPAYAATIIAVAFFVRMRPAIVLVLMLLSMAVLVDAAKVGLALPRPEHVDARVIGETAPVVERGGAHERFALPPAESIEAVRRQPTADFGFPSGHVASATVFALGVRALLAWKGAAWFAALWIPAMALSRLTLGRHFVADVLGGFTLGLAVLVVGLRVCAWLEKRPKGEDRWGMLLPAIVVVLALAVPWFSSVPNPRYLGSLAGVTIVAWVLAVGGWPSPAPEVSRRAAQCTIALMIHAGGVAALALLSPTSGPLALATAAIVATALLLPHRLVGEDRSSSRTDAR